MTATDRQRTVEANKEFYSTYWAHRWKYRLMYDTQIKKKLFLFAARTNHVSFGDKTILDIGFGSGDILFSFPRSCRLYGVDFSLNAVRNAERYAAQKGYSDANFLRIDLDERNLPFEDGQFDIIICSHVLEHLDDDVMMLEQIHRLLRDDGMAFILIPVNEKPCDDPYHVREYTKDSFKAQLDRIGYLVRYEFENEYVWHILSWFFKRRYHERIPLLGSLVSALINVPLALLPFRMHLWLDEAFASVGYPPRQALFYLVKKDDHSLRPAPVRYDGDGKVGSH